MLAAAILLAATPAAPPTAAEIDELETVRVLEPYADWTKGHRARVAEFAPSSETRDVTCDLTPKPKVFECRYQARTKGFFDHDFGVWQDRVELVRRNVIGRWTLVEQLSRGAALQIGCDAIRGRYPEMKIRCGDLDAQLSGERWIISERDREPQPHLGGGHGASISRKDGHVEAVWVHE